jgi:hypothetical protein
VRETTREAEEVKQKGSGTAGVFFPLIKWWERFSMGGARSGKETKPLRRQETDEIA